MSNQSSVICDLPSVNHSEAIDVLNKQLIAWFQQLGELNRGDFPDRVQRAAALRKRCHSVQATIKKLEEISS